MQLAHGTDRRARLADAVEIVFPLQRHCRIGAPERILLGAGPVPAAVIDALLADLHQRAADRNLRAEHGLQHLAGHGAGGDARCGLARGTTPAAALVAAAVLARKSTRLQSSHNCAYRTQSSA